MGEKRGIRSKSPVKGYLINANAWLAMPTVVRDLELVHHLFVFGEDGGRLTCGGGEGGEERW